MPQYVPFMIQGNNGSQMLQHDTIWSREYEDLAVLLLNEALQLSKGVLNFPPQPGAGYRPTSPANRDPALPFSACMLPAAGAPASGFCKMTLLWPYSNQTSALLPNKSKVKGPPVDLFIDMQTLSGWLVCSSLQCMMVTQHLQQQDI